ncbi:flavin reductase family protein [Cryptosporangium aurantiacum]|uniref:NADH-FMN oxidoreductase RutF, flavin reductase (DIM6/NTAB) family n=1 Tax=Cryptosporangium aurantiacum TaxID=134849 RepID=A0A1M7PDD4_9ACTN|nr:flavin reductase family protein [Cryptosporangium aurantiacum]SHN15019.1 NADH-FMN oxidoreductase RutF, flavin reductase (DIM6/NTAB) family [Cryptosporangium aurantiacum]
MNDHLSTAFRDVMAEVCTPVSVITAMDGVRPHGTTVSAFASLSMAPPMVLVSLDRGSNLLAVVRTTRRFGVNILGREQHGLASAFARKGADKFDGVPWTLAHGLPRLGGAPGWLACDLEQLVPGGDHFVALGTVLDAETRPGRPLTYHSRAFGTHTPLPSR